MKELTGKVAIVTGGAYGIGKKISIRYGEAGAKVLVAARTVGPMREICAELEKVGSEAIWVQTDVSKESECARMVEHALKSFGRVDILVNNAGIAGPTKRITEISLAEWQEVLDVDLTGAWLASRAVIPTMERQGSGNIVMISSGAGRTGFPLRSPYAAAKWAMLGLTQTLAGEWGMSGIRVNCICPGAIEGDRIERVIRARAESTGQPYEKVKQSLTSQPALKRMATEDEVARMALLLASDASSAVTGQTINVDCGTNMN